MAAPTLLLVNYEALQMFEFKPGPGPGEPLSKVHTNDSDSVVFLEILKLLLAVGAFIGAVVMLVRSLF